MDRRGLEPRRSVGEVLGDIGGNLQRIVQGETKLALAHVFERFRQARTGVALLAAGFLLAALATGVLLTAAVARLAEGMPLWQAALIVGAVTAVAGGAVIAAGTGALRRLDAPSHSSHIHYRGHNGNQPAGDRAGALAGTDGARAERG